ncbi:MAG: metallophosphoesterase [Planctomycetaceae bacterium]|nr:metallophosphoesterase [Planctomycetaceae bacterium]
MPRLVWLTDLHFNFVTEDQIENFAEQVREVQPDGVLIGGDLGEADSWEAYLLELSDLIQRPLYFVLGNHDYYRGSLYAVRERASKLSQEHALLHWLPESGGISLDDRTALVGHGGWGDARAAQFSRSNVLLNDYFLITELRTAAALPENAQLSWGDPSVVLNLGLEHQLQELGDETAKHFHEVIPQALTTHEHVIVLMHVPPFREACWHEGKTSDDNWAPHFCCIAAGEALLEIMKLHPHKKMIVLCGHTHSGGEAELLPNLHVLTGKAEYGQPAIQSLIDTTDLE